MTTTHKPIHPYAFWLYQYELFMGSGGIIVVLSTFPSNADNGVQPTAGDWVAYAFCLTLLFCRFLYVLSKEIPALNRLLKLTEYQKWTESFAHPTGNADEHSPKSPPFRAHQYRPWWVTVGSIALGIGLLATGVIVNGANKFEITLAGGYLVGVVSLIAIIEAFSRYSGMQTWKQKLLDRLFGKYPIGYDTYNPIREMKRQLPRSITHSKRNLDMAFADPLYLPEGYNWD